MVLLSTKRKEKKKKKLIFFFFFFLWFFAMISSFQGCFEVDFGLSLRQVLSLVYGRFVVSIGAGLSPIERVVAR